MAGAAPAVAGSQGPREAFVFLVEGVSFPDLLPLADGVALLSGGGSLHDQLRESLRGDAPVRVVDLGSLETSLLPEHPEEPVVDGDALLAAWDRIRAEVRGSSANEVLAVIATTAPPATQPSNLTPIALGRGDPAALLPAGPGPVLIPGRRLRALTSDSTRRVGVVTSADVVVTVLTFVGEPVPADVLGSTIRTTRDPPPFQLHERYLAMRRMTVPVQSAAEIYFVLGGLFGVGLLVLRRRVPARVARVGAWIAMSVPALAVALLAAGHLPTLSYATVVPFVVVATVAGTLTIAPLARRDVLLPPVAIAVAVLAYFVVESVLGWTAAQTPFLGGSELDGGRFYGLPNVFIGLLIGASLYIAARLSPVAGFALVVAVALFAGLPFAGANLGAAVSLFAAAGLWLPLRARGKLGWRELGVAAVVVVAGTAVVLLAHRFLTATPTHVTRFEEGAGLGEAWSTLTGRLAVGWRLIERNPFAIVPVVGLPATLIAVLRPSAPVGEALVRHPEWRDALLVTLLAGLVAYVANDTGAAASGLAFGLGLGGLLYVSLIEGTWKMEGA
ncbi:MAG: hypothetical protein ACRDH0_11125 [Actinomycetota bacterium]